MLPICLTCYITCRAGNLAVLKNDYQYKLDMNKKLRQIPVAIRT